MPQLSAAPREQGETELARCYAQVRALSESLLDGIGAEDAALQSMPDASPSKWHLAHTTWFFEQFVLGRDAGYRPFDARWHYLFNSYYQSVGPMHARPQRGLLSRPALPEVLAYRRAVDAAMLTLLDNAPDAESVQRTVLGLHHEQQHQELILTDIKHLFSCNPLRPAYRPALPAEAAKAPPLRFLPGAAGVHVIGHAGDGFAFDCETPRHEVLLQPHALANRPVSNAEFRAFVEDGGYTEPALWLSAGWETVQREGWRQPMYWSEDLQQEFTLAGMQPLQLDAPVCHISYFEADAYARWAGARLPTEAEWECAAAALDVQGNLLGSGALHPRACAGAEEQPVQCFGDVWEWTASPYMAYPGFRPLAGSLGEYNGKFMCGQQVLRGGSCLTPDDHVRASYRNFFYPPDRWQCTGLRLARDL